jgi:chromosome segregation ATPase
MNKIILIASMALMIVASSCKEKEKKQIELLTKENQALRSESQAKDSTINGYFQMLNEIESNLTLIKEKENIISKNTTAGNELKKDIRDQINEDIKTINELMAKNKRSIQYLNSKLKESNLKITELEKMIIQTNQTIQERDAEISVLKDKLTQMDFSITILNAKVDTLNTEKAQLTETVNKQVETINTAYYAFGTKKELELNKIIDKTGGFLGLGKTSKLKDDFDKTYFTKVDITKLTSIPLSAKTVKVITVHPTDSYQLVTNQAGVVEKIEIQDASKFWSASKYLVIVVE